MSPADRQRRRLELVPHLIRMGLSFAGLVVCASADLPVLAALAGAGLFVAAFSLNHDLMHGVLGLTARESRVLLSLSNLVMLMSGHATRRTHRVHHARPLAADDFEGAAANGSLVRALVLAPVDAARHRHAGYASAPPAERRIIVFELAAAAVLAVVLAAEPFAGARIYLCSSMVMQITMGVWAAWLPHRAPAWLLWVARHLSVLPSLAVRSLVHHDLHHERPNVPSAWLGA